MSTERRRWQYRVVSLGIIDTLPRMVGALGGLGAEGWELVATMDKASNWFGGLEKGFLLFKREVPSGASDPEGAWAESYSPPVGSGSDRNGWDMLSAKAAAESDYS